MIPLEQKSLACDARRGQSHDFRLETRQMDHFAGKALLTFLQGLDCVSNLYFDPKSKLLKTKRHADHVTFVDTARFKVLFSILYLDPSMS